MTLGLFESGKYVPYNPRPKVISNGGVKTCHIFLYISSSRCKLRCSADICLSPYSPSTYHGWKKNLPTSELIQKSNFQGLLRHVNTWRFCRVWSPLLQVKTLEGIQAPMQVPIGPGPGDWKCLLCCLSPPTTFCFLPLPQPCSSLWILSFWAVRSKSRLTEDEWNQLYPSDAWVLFGQLGYTPS